jgi:hypothetical protein
MQADRARRTIVAVRPEAELRARPRLFAALEAAFPVEFATERTGEAGAAIAIGEDVPDTGLPALVLGREGDGRPGRGAVRFGDHDPVDRRIRGVTVLDPLDGPKLSPAGGSTDVLASSGSRAAWTRARGAAATHRVASALPELEPPRTLRDLLAERPLALIALVEFLRACSPYAFAPPPLRAAILFDDPNLRWRTYGFIDYGELLAHADAHGYHASMAMIPLDGRHQHRATVELFRRRPDRLSLVFHGNDHSASELMQVESDGEAASIVAQALRRATHFESRYGLRIDRVMTAPHGMCSASVARALGPLGFDALCAIHPLPWSEHPPAGRPLAGWRPAEFAAGCAVIPRLPLTADAAEIALRAYLDQPVILYGHHEDLAGGLDLLAEKAATVNRLGAVRWSGLGQIATSNLDFELRDGTLRVRPYSHRLRLHAPEGVDSLCVERPSGLDANFAGWTAGSEVRPFGTPVPVSRPRLELRLAPSVAVDPTGVPAPRPSVWPVVRRAATEARDRLRPLVRVGTG